MTAFEVHLNPENHHQISDYEDWDVHPMPNPQPGGPECPSLSETSLLTSLAWETLPVAALPSA